MRDAAVARRAIPVPGSSEAEQDRMTADHQFHCITCGDDGVPMRVLRVDDERELALCEESGGERSTVEIGLVESVGVGDFLLVHAGTALTRVDAEAMA